MSFPDHYRFSFGGTLLGDTGEIWSNTINFAAPGEAGPVAVGAASENMLNALMDKLKKQFNDPISTTGLGYSSATVLKWGKFNRINAAGQYADASVTTVKDLVPTLPAGEGAVYYAPQLALAISFRTPVTRGPASAGRIFVPMPAVTPSSSGRIPPEVCQKLADNWGTLIKTFGDLPGLDLSSLRPCVVSGVGLGAAQPITEVRVGDRVDTIRSRRNALVEIYIRRLVSAAAAPPAS